MFKKLLKGAGVAAAGYAAYKIIEKHLENSVEVEPISADEIILMFKEKGLSAVLGHDQRVVHFINDDKSVAIKARVNEDNEVFLVEYYSDEVNVSSFEMVYPKSVLSESVESEKAHQSFRRLLGSIGVSEDRFIDLIKEIIQDPSLADLSI